MRQQPDLLELDRPRRPVLRYYGGKWVLAPAIIPHFPPHRIYCEPFGGAASVLIQKPRSEIEVYNDLDEEIVSLFRCLRDPASAAALIQLLQLTPFSRAEFKAAYQPAADPIERARRLVVRSFFGFGTHSFNSENSNGFRWCPSKAYAKEWSNWPHHIRLITSRLAGVTLECQPAQTVIFQQDTTDTLFFLDPPYPSSTRDSNKGYRFEMSDHDHRALAYILRQLKGRVILCGYPCSLYDQDLYPDWKRLELKHYASGQKGRVERTEVLWIKP